MFKFIPEIEGFPGLYYIFASTTSEISFYKRPVEDIVDELRCAIDNGYTRIIFDNMSEAMITEIVKKVELVIRLVKAPSSVKFYFTTSALNAKMSYLMDCKIKNKTPLFEPIVISVFESVMKSSYRYYLQNSGSEIKYEIKNKEKKFVCFNKVPRFHRIMTVAKLLEKDLFQQGYCSFDGDNDLIDCIERFLPENIATQFESFKNKLPLQLNITTNRSNPIDIVEKDIDYHKNSYFSIVTETTFYKNKIKYFTNCNTLNSIFLTEKTFRPIVLKHPFLIVTRPGSLRFLRKLGYKTFHPYIDESYDTINNDDKRLQKIIDEVDRLCKFSNEEWIEWQHNVLPILEHNYNLLMSKDKFLMTPNIIKLLS